MIFNRWGEKVFETNDMDKAWEGDHQLGSFYIPDSFYHYVLKAKSVHEYEVKEYKGSVYVFR
jgi:hypothetical protein